MRIGIIGFGYVGSAVAWAHQKAKVIIRDPKLSDSAELDQFTTCDAIYVCVPSPSTADGHCDTTILEETLKELFFALADNPIPIICKTTAPPRVYAQLQAQYPSIVHVPEFLTARDSCQDYLNTSYVVLGGEYDWACKARTAIQSVNNLTNDKFAIVPIQTAALYKYMMNSYLATKVTFMNDFKALADAEGVEFKDLAYLANFDQRIGTTHMDVPGHDGQFGWGGACFPKDIGAIIMEAIDKNVDFELLDRVESINKRHRRKE
jgi:UDPglucose 6-dehydrogenase